jgi:hypothetical protein
MQRGKKIRINDENARVYFTRPGMYYRGDWTQNQSYPPQSCVTVRSGSRSGLWLCVGYISKSAYPPGENTGDGTLWVKLADLEVHPLAE